MKVSELIDFLKLQPQDMQIVTKMHSEQYLLEITDITIEEHCYPRDDGWVPNKRPDKKSKKYLMLPGN